VQSTGADAGVVLTGYPLPGSPLRIEQFFPRLYHHYDERYIYAAPGLLRVTQRLKWSPGSPAFSNLRLEDEDHSGLEAWGRIVRRVKR
jgi:hypothetical protein